MARLILIALAAAVVFLFIRWLMRPVSDVRCSRCEGKGYWLGARGKEVCDWCKGTGRLPKS